MSIEDTKRHHLKGYDFFSYLSARCHELATEAIQQRKLPFARAQQTIGEDAYQMACWHRDEYLAALCPCNNKSWPCINWKLNSNNQRICQFTNLAVRE